MFDESQDAGPPNDGGPDTALFQIMPPLTPEEYAALEHSITQHGVLLPIFVDNDGAIIDGHHREEIARKLGVHCPRRTLRDLTDEQKIAKALTLNADRRHLTREQRRDLLATSIKAEPQASDREHGRRTGSSDKTAGAVRRELEERAEIPHVDKRADKVGRKQPAKKPETSATSALPWARWGDKRKRGAVESYVIHWDLGARDLCEFGPLFGEKCFSPDQAKEILSYADKYLAQLNSVRKLLRERAAQGGDVT